MAEKLHPAGAWDDSHGRDLKINVFAAPDRQACEKVFASDKFAGVLGSVGDLRGAWEVWAGDFASDRTACDLDSRIVTQTLGLSGVAACHHVEFAGIFREPDGRVYGLTGSSKGDEVNVLLAMKVREAGHRHRINADQ